MLKKFLWWCSGADIKILENAAPSDQAKFSFIGISILLTSLLSAISGGFAIFVFSDNIFLSLVLGLIWGILINSLNRLLFASIRLTRGQFPYNILYLLFHTTISLFIAFIIAVPLELKIFQASIKQNILQDRFAVMEKINSQYDSQIQQHYRTIDNNQKLLVKEVSGKGFTGSIGAGPVFHSIQLAIDSERVAIARIRQEEEKNRHVVSAAPIGLIDQVRAFSELTDRFSTYRIFSYVIRLLFISLEFIPILLKFSPNNKIYELMAVAQDSISQARTVTEDAADEGPNRSKNLFEDHCKSMMADLEFQMKDHKIKSGEMLRNGLIIIIAAILLYAGIAYYLIAIFFEQHPFKVQYIYFMISLSLLFIFLQFLGGWFLQQYKSAMKSILDIIYKANVINLGNYIRVGAR